MNQKLRRLTLSAVAAAVLAVPFAAQVAVRADEPLKIGFLVKMPEQAWFINEQKAATAVGQKVTLSGTFDSYTPKPLMIIMSDGTVVLPKKTPARAPVHHTAPRQ